MRACQQLIAQDVLALGARLVHLAQATRFERVSAAMIMTLSQRRVLLRRLQHGIGSDAELSCVQAVSGAVAEFDRALLTMIDTAAAPRH